MNDILQAALIDSMDLNLYRIGFTLSRLGSTNEYHVMRGPRPTYVVVTVQDANTVHIGPRGQTSVKFTEMRPAIEEIEYLAGLK